MLYFRGCVAREKVKTISKSTEAILKKASIDFKTISGENCCGSVLLRTGFLKEAKEQMEENLVHLENETILVSCAGCYKTFKDDYKEILGVELNIIHTSQLFRDLINENKLIFEKYENESIKVTYHDPCHLGRHSGEYEAPREVINFISSLIEMENIRENSRCCGSGGGVKSAFPEIASTIAKERIKEAKKTEASLMVTACPFCKLNLNQSDLEVLDLSEFLFNQLFRKSVVKYLGEEGLGVEESSHE